MFQLKDEHSAEKILLFIFPPHVSASIAGVFLFI